MTTEGGEYKKIFIQQINLNQEMKQIISNRFAITINSVWK